VFLQLAHSLRSHGITLLLTGMRPRVESLLRSHGVIAENQGSGRGSGGGGDGGGDDDEEEAAEPPLCQVFDTLDLALEECEEKILATCPPTTPVAGSNIGGRGRGGGGSGGELQRHDEASTALARIMCDFMEGEEEAAALLSVVDLSCLERYWERQVLDPGSIVFTAHSAATAIYVLESGDVSLFADADMDHSDAATSGADTDADADADAEAEARGGTSLPTASSKDKRKEKISKLVRIATPRTGSSIGDDAEASAAALVSAGLVDTRRRVQRFRDGGLFGNLDFFLKQRRSFTAETGKERCCVVHRLSSEKMQLMAVEQPGLMALVHLVCLRSLCLDVQSISYLL